MIVIAEKESFIVRVLIKKTTDARIGCEFVPLGIDTINTKLDSASLITLFLEDNSSVSENIIHFLSDSMVEKGLQMIVIGQPEAVADVICSVPPDIIYKTFPRPVDNDKFAEAVAEYFHKIEAGDFKKSILVVDDNPEYLSLVREWLKGTYNVSMATSGLQAIKWLGKNKVDLILLDYEMPVTSGPQVLEMLRSDSETCSIPVMFLTGRGDKDSVVSVLELKPEGYFLKTIQKDELLEKLHEFFMIHR